MWQKTVSRQELLAYARNKFEQNPVYLDTETTGLNNDDEIVEIAVIDRDGNTLINSLVKPTRPIPAAAIMIHGISNEMVDSAPSFPEIWPDIQALIAGRPVGIYNAEYDVRLIKQSMARHKQSLMQQNVAFDIMSIYSDFRGEWNPNRNMMRRFRLEEAGTYFGIPLPNSHRALDDAKLARALFHAILGERYQD